MSADSQKERLGKSEWVLDQRTFDCLLAWLDADRDRAGKKYEDIRLRIIKIFSCRGCGEAEELADKTIDRVAKKLENIAGTYIGDPALYFYGVAQNVYLEYLKKKPVVVLPSLPEPSDDEESQYECLESCMQELPAESRELVLEYYQEEKGNKIAHRKRLAQRLGIGINALRIRACRIRETLFRCVLSCLSSEMKPQKFSI